MNDHLPLEELLTSMGIPWRRHTKIERVRYHLGNALWRISDSFRPLAEWIMP